MQFYFAVFRDLGYAFYAFKVFSPLFYGFSSGDSHCEEKFHSHRKKQSVFALLVCRFLPVDTGLFGSVYS